MKSERWVDVAMIAAAATIAGTLVLRELGERTHVVGRASNEHLPEWEQLLDAGVWLGDRDAAVKVIVFGDLECPACRQLHADMQGASVRVRSATTLVFIHFPLPQHRFAQRAARALECADEVGRGAAMLDVLFSQQDSLGLKSWAAYALEAGIGEVDGFEECAVGNAPKQRIASGVAIGQQIALTGTPTVIVNGWRYGNARDFALNMERDVDLIMRGGSPFANYRERRLGR